MMNLLSEEPFENGILMMYICFLELASIMMLSDAWLIVLISHQWCCEGGKSVIREAT